MLIRKSFFAGAVVAGLLAAATAQAQTTTTGAVQGVVSDQNGAALAGCTIVATSDVLQGDSTEASDDAGAYFLSNLPPGTYLLTFIYGEITIRRENVIVYVGKVTTVPAKVNTDQVGGEVIVIKTRAPMIDAGSAKQGMTIDQDYTRNVPTGRNYEDTLGAAAGSQGDLFGISFSGSTSVENNYVVDGINTTGLTYGTVGSPLLNNFIQEIEVITGGYNAEFGRSTGGVVNVVTKSGSNEFHGSVWSSVTPFQAERDRLFFADTSLSSKTVLGTDLDFGFDLGGPIVKDKLWFYVGFAPVITRAKFIRVVSTRVNRSQNGIDYDQLAATGQMNADGTPDGDNDPQTTTAVGCETTQTCESDGVADIDPSTGFERFEEVDRREFVPWETEYQFTGKLNFAVSPNHQGQLSLVGSPSTGRIVASPRGTSTATQEPYTSMTTDAAFKWTSKLLNNKTQLDVIAGWHHDRFDGDPGNERLPDNDTVLAATNSRSQVIGDIRPFDLGQVGRNHDEKESDRVLDYCTEGDPTIADPFPLMNHNCPVDTYDYNSGFVERTQEDRYSGKLTATHRVKFLGHHQLKAGADFEDNFLADDRMYTGGAFYQLRSSSWRVRHFIKLSEQDACLVHTDDSSCSADAANGCSWDGQACHSSTGATIASGRDVCRTDTDLDGLGDTPVPCDYYRPVMDGEDPTGQVGQALPVRGETFNYSAFAQDQWSIMPNLTFNLGFRWEVQKLKYSDNVRGVIDPITRAPIPSDAVVLDNLYAPRIGLIYDWTKEGKSKVYASFGRFYESIPMDINDRAFGGEVEYESRWNAASRCGGTVVGGDDEPRLPSRAENCPQQPSMDGSVEPDLDFATGANSPVFGIPNGVTLVTPGLKPQYLDELVVGVEYEVLEDLRLGLSYQNRRLGRVIEDVSLDGATTYIIANPGEFPQAEEDKLERQIMELEGQGDPTLQSRIDALNGRLDMYRGIRKFDKPTRDYNAVQLTAVKRFSRSFMMQGSYTYSVLRGNYPGLFAPDTAQLDPNISSQYDLIELLANRDGPLPHDRPHSFKLDGYYTIDLKQAGRVTAGARLRGQSGEPIQTLGSHALYDAGESFILPRGTEGRTAFLSSADLHLGYGRKLGKNMDLEVYLDLFNVFNAQTQTSVDTEYTADFVEPIVGGGREDLAYLKTDGDGDGITDGTLATRNKNYGNTISRLSPLTGRIGAVLTF